MTDYSLFLWEFNRIELMAKELFRKVALERASSPEQLDQLITITTPLGWVSLLSILICLLAAISWGIFGSIPEQVDGPGILLTKAGIVSIQTQTSGKLTKINVEIGDVVEKGQIVARIEQEDLLDQLRQAQLELKNLETAFEKRKGTEKEAVNIQLEKLRQDQLNQNQQIRNLENQLAAQQSFKTQQQEIKVGYQQLVTQGIISKTKVLEVANEIVRIDQNINTLKLNIEEAKNQLNTIALELKKIEGTGALDNLTQAQKVESVQLTIKTLQSKFAESSQIVSSTKGKVVEIPRQENDLVGIGTPIILLEEMGENVELEVMVYFSPLTGKQVRKGMNAQITPSIVKREEYGFLEGTITNVDKYPSTLATVMKTVQNESLARMLASDAAPIRVVASLIPDAKTTSGYKWSSRNGPPMQLDSGTICSVSVTVRDQAPITLVIPLLKRYILGEGK
jgi:HlyD family secretion protein